MTLIDKLFDPESVVNNIVVVENAPVENSGLRTARLEKKFGTVFGKQVTIQTVTPDQAKELPEDQDYNFLLNLNTRDIALLTDQIAQLSLRNTLISRHPNSNC